jgi:RimJ/RimL family protein N-acetyltransferase
MTTDEQSRGAARTLKASLAQASQFDEFYRLRCDPENVYWTGHTSAPSREGLQSWYLKNLQTPSRTILLFHDDDAIAGYLYIDTLEPATWEIGYGVHHEMAGRGFGSEIVRSAEQYVRQNLAPAGQLLAWIADTNIGSIRCVSRNGFQITDQTQQKSLGGEAVVFRLYQKDLSASADLLDAARTMSRS